MDFVISKIRMQIVRPPAFFLAFGVHFSARLLAKSFSSWPNTFALGPLLMGPKQLNQLNKPHKAHDQTDRQTQATFRWPT